MPPTDDEPPTPPAGRVPRWATTLGLLVLPVVLVYLARRAGVVSYHVMRAVGELSREGPAQWWMAGGPEPAARVVQLFVGALVLVALVAVVAAAARRPPGRTLGLVAGRASPGVWAMLAVGSFAALLSVALVVEVAVRVAGVPAQRASVGHYFDLVAEAPLGIAIAMIAVASLGAGVSEELLMRGWLQNRLLERWRPRAAIVLAALDFALVHGEPARMLYALALGLWLGYVAWRAASVVPAMICHAAINAAPLTAVRLGLDLDLEHTPAPVWGATGLVLAGCGVLGVVAVRRLERAARATGSVTPEEAPPRVRGRS